MKRFRVDNTEGYQDYELDILNTEFERRTDESLDPDELDNISEQVLRDFDANREDRC